jgi:preprotein translocase subunit SecA
MVTYKRNGSKRHNYAIVDEVESTNDEARTPLIISDRGQTQAKFMLG